MSSGALPVASQPPFDVEKGVTVIAPPGIGPGWWAGACSVVYEQDRRRFLLYYRLRKSRELGRGVECRVAASTDGLAFETIWAARQEEFPTASMERAALVRLSAGGYRLYVSYVDPADNRWRIDLLEAPAPEAFDIGQRRPVLTAADIDAEGVKDPVLLWLDNQWNMLVSYAPRPEQRRPDMHATGDIYATGVTKSHTGLALSADGRDFRWQGDVFSPGKGWDAYAARVSAVLPFGPVFLAFYDGAAGVEENYEERTGLAVSLDLRHFVRLTWKGPLLTSPHGSGSLRYLAVVLAEEQLFYYYEYARPDGSHELRVNAVPAPLLCVQGRRA